MTDEIIDLQALQNKMNPKSIFAIAVLAFLAIAVYSSVYTVDQMEKAVVLRLGEFHHTAEPGLNFKLPFGVDKNYNVETEKIHKEEFGFRTQSPGVRTEFRSHGFENESIMLTGDLNIVDVQWIIQYKIEDPEAWLFNVEHREKTIRDISQSVINLLVGDRTIFDVIGSERANIEQIGQEKMNEFFTQYDLGAKITTVKLQNIVPPRGEVQNAFEDVNKAIQDRKRLINEGKESYNKTIPRASGEAEKTIQEAEGYATEKVNKAIGDVARFLAVYGEYKKSPKVTRMRLYYEMIEEVFKKTGETDLIDKNLKNFIPFKSLSGKALKKGGK
ncbi:MAG: FtsH protease activity modulator HflK [bacterium]|nr:FtsH protease activity modulator HflK [bacterium]